LNHATPSSPTDSAATGRSDRISKTIAYYVAFVALGLVTAALGPTLPGLADHTHTLLSQISFLFTARALGYLLGSLLGGRLYDRMPGHPVMAGVLVLMASMLIFVPLIPALWLLTIVLLFVGATEGTLDVGGNALLVWVHGREVGPFMNGLHFFFGVGAFLSPIIIAQAVLLSGDIQWAFWTLALLVLPVALLLARLSSPAAPKITQDGPSGQVNILLALIISLFFLLYVGAESSFGGWIYTYATALDLSDKTTAAYLTSVFWGALTAGRLLSIPVAARFRPRAILFGDLAGCLISVGVILLWPGSSTVVWIGVFGVGFSMASIFPTMISFAGRHMTLTGRVTAWFFVGSSSGGMILPWVIGQLFESIGPRVTMVAIFSDLVLAIAVFLAVMFYATKRES
jgi:FHS family Na+ dependent glucose MFS transporter 1